MTFLNCIFDKQTRNNLHLFKFNIVDVIPNIAVNKNKYSIAGHRSNINQ